MPPIQSKLMQSRLNNQTDRGKPPLGAPSNLGGPTDENMTLNGMPRIETDEDKIQRYERVIDHLKKMIDTVKKQNKTTRMQFEREIASKTELEHYFKKAVDKVLKERKQAREEKRMRQSHNKFYITALDSEPKLSGPIQDDNELDQEERERVIELLLGKEKVIALLYDILISNAQNPDFGTGEHQQPGVPQFSHEMP